MNVEHVEVIVEEQSMAEAMRVILESILDGISFEVHQHQCKQDLLKSLPDRLRGYAAWIPDAWVILVVVDRDNDDCNELKSELEEIAARAGLVTRSKAGGGRYVVLNRIAIEELEAWFFGDWEAVCVAYPRVPRTVPQKSGFRDPDAVTGGTWEAFERVLQRSGYFKTGLRKIEAARAIAVHMDYARNRSQSFRALRDALLELAPI